jgi:hypothetical protein
MRQILYFHQSTFQCYIGHLYNVPKGIVDSKKETYKVQKIDFKKYPNPHKGSITCESDFALGKRVFKKSKKVFFI